MRFGEKSGSIGVFETSRKDLIHEFDAKMWIDRKVDDIELLDSEGNIVDTTGDDDAGKPDVPPPPPRRKGVRPPMPTLADLGLDDL
jgi:hypothetical protein